MRKLGKWTFALFLTGLVATGFSALGHDKGFDGGGSLQPPVTVLNNVSLDECAATAGGLCTNGVKSLKYVSDTGECSFTCMQAAAQ